MQAELARDGEQKLFLEVRETNLAARCLYAKTGFEQIGIRPGYYRASNQNESPEDAQMMACSLGATKAYKLSVSAPASG